MCVCVCVCVREREREREGEREREKETDRQTDRERERERETEREFLSLLTNRNAALLAGIPKEEETALLASSESERWTYSVDHVSIIRK